MCVSSNNSRYYRVIVLVHYNKLLMNRIYALVIILDTVIIISINNIITNITLTITIILRLSIDVTIQS